MLLFPNINYVIYAHFKLQLLWLKITKLDKHKLLDIEPLLSIVEVLNLFLLI
jgi:hypothetical protein